MAQPNINGQFFERIQVLVSTGTSTRTALDQSAILTVTTTGDEQLTPVAGQSADHLIPGVVRGNGQYTLTIVQALRYGTLPIDWRQYDYDNTVISFALFLPNAQYGTNNVFGTTSNYLQVYQVWPATTTPIDVPGVGQPATSTVSFIVRDWDWVSRVTA